MPAIFQPWALLAESSSGSTWVNHVLASHPCASSLGEILMSNKTASEMFHGKGVDGIVRVLYDAAQRQKEDLARTRKHCHNTAGGLKLKLVERDVTFGREGNNYDVIQALAALNYNVIVLQRSNHLDSILGRLSRRRTGVLHCKSNSLKCDAAKLNMSVTLSCAKAKESIDRFRLRMRAKAVMFPPCTAAASSSTSTSSSCWPDAKDGTGRVLHIDYEELVQSPEMWYSLVRLLRLPASSGACELRDRDHFQKRVTQTQRELIRNWEGLSSCLRRAGSAYSKLLRADHRPTSGRLPRDSVSSCPRAA